MRELKFRAWDRLDKEFAHNIDCLLDMTVAERIFALDDEGGELIIEQYTGLKDKNGKEIYEGDIILVDNRDYLPYIVVYREWDCSFIGENDDREGIVHICNKTPQRYEIIGNIHENPELTGGEEE